MHGIVLTKTDWQSYKGYIYPKHFLRGVVFNRFKPTTWQTRFISCILNRLEQHYKKHLDVKLGFNTQYERCYKTMECVCLDSFICSVNIFSSAGEPDMKHLCIFGGREFVSVSLWFYSTY